MSTLKVLSSYIYINKWADQKYIQTFGMGLGLLHVMVVLFSFHWAAILYLTYFRYRLVKPNLKASSTTSAENTVPFLMMRFAYRCREESSTNRRTGENRKSTKTLKTKIIIGAESLPCFAN